MSGQRPASEAMVRKLRRSGVLPACEAVLSEFAVEDWAVEAGGKHPIIVFEHGGIEHRYPMPMTGITKGPHASRYVAGNLRRKLRGAA